MPKPNKKDAAKTFLQGVLEKLPEDKRGAFAAALEVEDALDYVGDGVLRQADYSRVMNEVAADRQKLDSERAWYNEWYAANQAAIAESVSTKTQLEKMQEQLRGLQGGGEPEQKPASAAPTIDTSKFLTKEEAQQLGQQIAMQGWNNTSAAATLAARHMKEFGDVLDINALAQHAQKTGKNLQDAWSDMHHEQLEAKAKAAEKKREDELRRQIREEERAALLGSQGPYPVPNNSEPSTLAGLSGKGEYGIAAAAKEYNDLLRARGQ